MRHRKYIGVDPSLNETGVVCLEKDNAYQPKCIKIKPKTKHGDLIPVESRVERIIEAMKWYLSVGDVLCIEENVINPKFINKSALQQAQLIGAICHQAIKKEMEIVRVKPTQAKKALAGVGNADKIAMTTASRAYFASTGIAYKDKARADALGAALAGRKIYERRSYIAKRDTR